MTRRASTFRQSDVERAVKAARAAGLDVGSVEVAPDGTIRVVTATANENEQPGGGSPFDQWKAKHGTCET